MKAAGSISLLPFALPERPSSRAFTIQYTTLVLIVISFIVGAFSGRPATSVEQPSTAAVAVASVVGLAGANPTREVEGRTVSDSIRIEHLFKPASVDLDSAKAGALAAVLKSHDIDAEIDVLADSMGEEDYRIALRQARALERFLRKERVPSSAFRVFVVESRVPEWAAIETASSTAVRFYRGGHDER